MIFQFSIIFFAVNVTLEIMSVVNEFAESAVQAEVEFVTISKRVEKCR